METTELMDVPTTELPPSANGEGSGGGLMSVSQAGAALEQVLALGMEEGLTQAVGQIDAILAEGVTA